MRSSLQLQDGLDIPIRNRLGLKTLGSRFVLCLLLPLLATSLFAQVTPEQASPAQAPAVQAQSTQTSQTPQTSQTIANPLAALMNDPLVKIAQIRPPSIPMSYDFTIESFTTNSLPALSAGPITFSQKLRFRLEGHAKIKRNLVDIRKREFVWNDGKWNPASITHQLSDGKRFWTIQQSATPELWCPIRLVNQDTTQSEVTKAVSNAGGVLQGQFPFFPTGDWLYAALMVPNTLVSANEQPIGGFPCRQVKFRRGMYSYTFWVDMQHGGFLRQMEVIFPEKPLSYWKRTLTIRGPEEIELTVLELRDVEIQKVGDREMPVAGTFVTRTFYRNGEQDILAQRIRLSNIMMNPPDQGKYEIDLPEGTVVSADKSLLKYEWRKGELTPYLDPAITAVITESIRKIASEASSVRPALLQGYRLSASDMKSSSSFAAAGNSGLSRLCNEGMGPLDGFYCLYASLRLAGIGVKPDSIFSPKYIDGFKGSSLTQLETAARKLGLYTYGTTSLTARMLGASPYPILLRVKKTPYSKDYDAWELFLGKRDGHAWIWNIASPPHLESMASLIMRWNGSGLILSTAPVNMFRLWLSDILLATLAITALALFLWQVRRFVHGRGKAMPVTGLMFFIRRSTVEGIGFVALALVVGLLWHAISGTGLLTAHGASIIRLSRSGLFLTKIGIDDVQRIVGGQEKATIIDARSPFDFFLGHIPTAKNVPLSSNDDAFQVAIAGLPRNGRLVIYCSHKTCHVAEALAARMAASGFTNLEIFEGGWLEWSRSQN